MATAARKPAPRLARPAQRHFAKKAPKDARDFDESSDEEQEAIAVDANDEGNEEEIGGYTNEAEFLAPGRTVERNAKPLKVALGNVEVKDGRVIVDGQFESGKTIIEQQEEEESSESEEEEEESSEEESESEEEELPKPQLRPVFVTKGARGTLKERDAVAFDSEEAVKKREAAAEERRKQSRNMVGETVKRGLEEKEAKEVGKEIDDTDGIDPGAEFDAWRLRELMRLKRDKEAEQRREEERLEIERRRAMPEEQRLKEDLERAQKLRDEKPKGQGAFLQKYWHKGAFYQDMDELKRDLSKPVESHVDVSMLPKAMQVKDFGKRSRTKYTHLKDQDTSLAQPPPPGKSQNVGVAGSQGCFLCGGPHLKRDCPQNTGPPGQRGSGTGANDSNLPPKRRWGDASGEQREKNWRDRSPRRSYDRSRSPRRAHESNRRYDDERPQKSYTTSGRRSRSPPYRRRSRSASPRHGRARSRSKSPSWRSRNDRSDRSPKRRRRDS